MDRTIRNSYPTTSYNTTSNAYVYDYEYMALEEDRVRKQKVQEHRAIRQKEAVKRKSVVHRLKFVAAIAFVFAGCILTMVTNATVDRYRVNNNKLRTELSTLKNENLNLVSEMTNTSARMRSQVMPGERQISICGSVVQKTSSRSNDRPLILR